MATKIKALAMTPAETGKEVGHPQHNEAVLEEAEVDLTEGQEEDTFLQPDEEAEIHTKVHHKAAFLVAKTSILSR